MKHPQHHNAVSNDAIAEDIFCAQDLKNDLAVGALRADRTSKFRAGFQNSRLGDNFACNDRGKPRMTIAQEVGKAIEVGERERRPLNFHCSRQGLKAGVPQVSSQRTTFSWGTVGAPPSISNH